MSEREPTRLSQSMSAPHALRDALDRASADLPDEKRLVSIAAKLGAAGGGADAGGGASSGSVAKTVSTTLPWKWTIVGALGVAAVGTTALVSRSRPPSTWSEPRSLSLAESTTTAPPSVPSASSSSAPASPRPPRAVEPPDPAAEIALLKKAQDALRSDALEALRLAEEHARRYRRGSLAEEREVIAIEALVRLRRTSEAEARARAFANAFPDSAHQRRVNRLLGETTR